MDDIAADGQGALAGRGARLLAVIIDGLLGSALLLLVSWATPFHIFQFDFSRTASAAVPPVQPLRLAQTLGLSFLIFVLLHGYLLHTRGQTIGKLAMNIRIVRSDGSRASLLRLAGVRYFVNNLFALIPMGVGAVYFLLDALMIFRTSHKCLHDNIADTIVVKA